LNELDEITYKNVFEQKTAHAYMWNISEIEITVLVWLSIIFTAILCSERSINMIKNDSLVRKTVGRIFAWFFLFLIIISLFGIALIIFGLPGIYLFLNPSLLLVVSAIFSCCCATIFSIVDLKKNRTANVQK
jgi:hypothetical protein